MITAEKHKLISTLLSRMQELIYVLDECSSKGIFLHKMKFQATNLKENIEGYYKVFIGSSGEVLDYYDKLTLFMQDTVETFEKVAQM